MIFRNIYYLEEMLYFNFDSKKKQLKQKLKILNMIFFLIFKYLEFF